MSEMEGTDLHGVGEMTARTDLHNQYDAAIPRRARLAVFCGGERQLEIDEARQDLRFWREAIQVNLGVLYEGGYVSPRDRANAINQHVAARERLAELEGK